MPHPPLRDFLLLPKQVGAPPRRIAKNGPHVEIQVPVTGDMGALVLYMRRQVDRPQSFSIGLRLETASPRAAMLARVNGPHAPHTNPDGTLVEGPHIHGWSEEDMNSPPDPTKEPKVATPLTADNVAMTVAWRSFCVRFQVASTPEVDTLVDELEKHPLQLSLL
jgi:hypothetical protein